jgi:hypothetical protein
VREKYYIDMILINNRIIDQPIIDPHTKKHKDHIDHSLIKEVVLSLHGDQYIPVARKDDFLYFATNINYNNSFYKLVWLLQDYETYIGVITLYKDRRINEIS